MASESRDKRRGANLKDSLLSDRTFAFLIVISVFNFAITLPRFYSGIPNGIDSSTHIFKALYLHTNYEQYNRIPTWCSSWYGGVPFLQLYSPLSYYVLFVMGLIGFEIVFAYKLLDCFFYVITPLSVYFLARSLRLSKKVSVLAAAVFSITPLTIENFTFYDRFTTILALPFMCLFLGFFHKFLENSKTKDGVLSILSGAALLLIHHLTAYATGIFVVVLLLAHYFKNRNLKRLLKATTLTLLGITLLSAFWLVPFVTTVGRIAENKFYNRSNLYDFLEFSTLKTLLESFNIFQFLFSILAIGLLIKSAPFRKHGTIFKITIFTSFLLILEGFILHAGKFDFASYLTVVGFGVFVLSYIGLFLEDSSWKRNSGLLFSGLWFIILLWLNLGKNAYLFSVLPFWDKLDILRFQNFMVIPEAILTSSFIVDVFKGIRRVEEEGGKVLWRGGKSMGKIIIGLLVVTSIIWGFQMARSNIFLRVHVKHYRPNKIIPPGIIDYFDSRSGNGRIMSIRCPDWIFILPTYTEKPIIDGWYPQEKLLIPLLEINDYRINDLVCTLQEHGKYGEANQTRIWLNLINNSTEFGISWVMIGDESKKSIMNGTNFKLSTNITGIYIYEATDEVSFVDVFPRNRVGDLGFSRVSPEEMRITLEDVGGGVYVKVKEAYYPGWSAYVDGSKTEVGADDYGFISFRLSKGEAYSIVLSYEKNVSVLYWIISIATLLALLTLLKLRHRVFKQSKTT